jgi:hypothetical protein
MEATQMHASLKDHIAGLRLQAKEHRRIAGELKRLLRMMRERPMASRDPITAMRCQNNMYERYALARQCDAEIKRLKEQMQFTPREEIAS